MTVALALATVGWCGRLGRTARVSGVRTFGVLFQSLFNSGFMMADPFNTLKSRTLNSLATEGAGVMGTGGGARMPRFVQEQYQWAAQNGVGLTPEMVAKNVQSRIRQIEYDRRLSGWKRGDDYPPNGELFSLRSWLRGE